MIYISVFCYVWWIRSVVCVVSRIFMTYQIGLYSIVARCRCSCCCNKCRFGRDFVPVVITGVRNLEVGCCRVNRFLDVLRGILGVICLRISILLAIL